MTRKSFLMAVVFIASTLADTARADFRQDAAQLAADARKLADVTISMAEPVTLSDAARQMDFAADRMARCAAQYLRLPSCRFELQEVQRSFNALEYTVRGIIVSQPVGLQLSQLRVSMRPFLYSDYPPPPAPGYIRASGWLEQFGFDFRAYDQNGIYNQCVNFAYYYRLRAVANLTVNGLRYSAPWGRAWYVEDACRIVASRAF